MHDSVIRELVDEFGVVRYSTAQSNLFHGAKRGAFLITVRYGLSMKGRGESREGFQMNSKERPRSRRIHAGVGG
jgi:hypothetical protein